jgi:hypothetical protein
MDAAPQLAITQPVLHGPELAKVYVLRRSAHTDDLPALVVRIIPLFDGRRTLAGVCGEAQISAERGLAVVRKLSRLGILSEMPKTRTIVSESLERAETLRGLPVIGRPVPAFSAAEDEFFASEVQPVEEEEQRLGERLSQMFSSLELRLRGGAAL